MSIQIYNDAAFTKANYALIEFIHLLVDKETQIELDGVKSNILPPEIIKKIEEYAYFSDNTKFLKTLCLLNKKNNSIFNHKIIRRDKLENNEVSSFIYGDKSFSRIRKTTKNPTHKLIPRYTTELKVNIIPHVKKIGNKFYFCHPEVDLFWNPLVWGF